MGRSRTRWPGTRSPRTSGCPGRSSEDDELRAAAGVRVPAVVASSSAAVAFGVNFTNVGAIAEQIAHAYGVGLPTVGLFTTTLIAVHALLQIPGGRITDRYGARRLTIASLAIVALSNVALLAAADLAAAIVLRATAGVGTAVGFVAATQLIRGAGGTAIAHGVYGGVGYGSTAIPLAVVPVLQQLTAWRAPYLLALAIAGVALLLVAGAQDSGRPPAATAEESVRSSLFIDLRLYRLAAMHGIALLGLVVGNWISTYYVRAFGTSIATAGLLGSVALLGGIATRPLSGWVVHRRPDLTRRVLAFALLLGAAGTGTLAVAPSAALAAVGACVLGLAAGVPFAPAIFGAGRVRPEAPGTAVGLVNTVGNLGLMVGTPLFALPFAGGADGRIGFAVLAVVWVAGLFALPRAEELGASRPDPAAP